MNNQSTLQVKGVDKTYLQYSSELSRVLSWFGMPLKPVSENRVLKQVSFSVEPGEAIGIVGQNGAGKSTLLKIITGTQKPTQGSVQFNGRIGSILELGMGFNREFTGRQNAFHAAGLMGFSQASIQEIMPEIESFAEIGDYFDQPVSTYSSGMQMRVAFSVVTAFRPDLLIVDEALSVGDTYFQHKSFGRIREFQKQGSSLLLVSHDRGAIQSICNRAVLLEKGEILYDDTPSAVIDYYNALIAEKENKTVTIRKTADGGVQTISGTGEAKVTEIMMLNSEREPVDFINVGDSVILQIKVSIYQAISTLVLGYMIRDRLGQTMYGTNTAHTQQTVNHLKQGDSLTYSVQFSANLGPGTYSISTALADSDTHLSSNYEWKDLACIFEVANQDKTAFVGSAWIEPNITIER